MTEAKTQSFATRLPSRDGEKGEGSVAFKVTKPVDLDSLGRELVESHGWERGLGLISEGSASKAGPKTPAVIWVLAGDLEVNTNKVKSVVDHHELPRSEYNDLVTKAQTGQDFTPEETQKILRIVLLGR